MIELLNNNFYDGFAKRTSERIIAENTVGELCTLLEKCITTPSHVKKMENVLVEKIEFRAAFVLETLYLGRHKELLQNFIPRLFSLLPQVTNPSTKRHFGKIVCKELEKSRYLSGNIITHSHCKLTQEQLFSIMETMQEWAIFPKARPVVKIWAINTLLAIRKLYLQIDVFQRDNTIKHKHTSLGTTPDCTKNLVLLESFLKDFIEYESVNPPPSMKVSLRLWMNLPPQS